MQTTSSTKRIIWAALALFAINLSVHAVRFGWTIDNSIITPYAPGSNDPADYANRAEIWAHYTGFQNAFADGYRVPGYPAYLLPFLSFFDEPYRAARAVQLLLSSTLPSLMLILAALITKRLAAGVIAGGLTLAWVPLSYFAPILVPETQSLVCITLLGWCMTLLPECRSKLWWHGTVGALLAVLIYLKPNHVLLIPPFIGFVAYQMRHESWLRRGWASVPACCVAVALVAPWSIFASSQTGMFVPLSTTQGLNLYLGIGMGVPANAETGLHDIVAKRLNLQDQARDEQILAEAAKLSVPESHKFYQAKAKEIWKERPLATATYGLAKVAHSFGASLRGMKDWALLLHTTAVFAATAWLWRRGEHRGWCMFLALSFVFEAAQAFWFLPNIRFKTIFLDLQATIVLALAIESVWRARFSANSAITRVNESTKAAPLPQRRAA